MADISKEIENFRDAVEGEEVRGSMISLATKVNAEVVENTEHVNTAATTANEASQNANWAIATANDAIKQANTTLEAANTAKASAQASATASSNSATSAAQSKTAAANSATAAAASAAAAEQAAGCDGTAKSISATDAHGLGSTNVQGQLDALAAPAFDASGTAPGIASFPDFINLITSGMRILDFFKNLKAGLKFVLHAGQLVNNGLCNTPGKYPLDAAYGKILLDMIGNVSNLPGGAANVVAAIIKQNSDLGGLKNVEMIPLKSEYVLLGGAMDAAYIARVGPVKVLKLTTQFTSAIVGGTSFYLMPEGYRPTTIIKFPTVITSGTSIIVNFICIYPDGRVTMDWDAIPNVWYFIYAVFI